MTTPRLEEMEFAKALSEFRKFLDRQNETDQILWTFKEDVYSRNTEIFERDFWIKLPLPGDNEEFVRRAYRMAQARNVGLGFSAYARCSDGLCCTLIIPADDGDAQYLMMSPEGIRYSLVNDMPTATPVRSRVDWLLFGLVPFLFRRGNYVVYLLSKRDLESDI